MKKLLFILAVLILFAEPSFASDKIGFLDKMGFPIVIALIAIPVAISTVLIPISLVAGIIIAVPVFIVSGSIGQIEKSETALFKKRLRDQDFKEILTEIKNIYDTGLTKILNNKGIIEEYLNN